MPTETAAAKRPHILVIGGGPAGLRAAEVAAEAGAEVTLCDQKPSFGRKFLVAGKGGLNLTHGEPMQNFATRYNGPAMPRDFWKDALADFDNAAMREWAARLGAGTFAASSGRVYPKSLKGAPLFRAWLQKLGDLGVVARTQHRFVALNNTCATFATAADDVEIAADAIILALGGGSWRRTGSDGEWVDILRQLGVEVHDLVSANCGWNVAWPDAAIDHLEGVPLKNLTAHAAESRIVKGEVMLTRYGIEGGPIYALGPALRAMENPAITLDLKPAHDIRQLLRKAESVKRDLVPECLQRWKLLPAVQHILEFAASDQLSSVESIAALVKGLSIPLTSPRPLDEAISSAGGVAWHGLDAGLMLKSLPKVFVAGEMIDWEAPTGGYLLHGCIVSGERAARAALRTCSG